MQKTAERHPQERGLATQDLLIRTAIHCFTTAGYDASSTRQIETLAGVKRGLISYHFGSKEDLWKAAASRLIGESFEDLTDTFETSINADPVGKLRFIVRAYVRFCARHPELNRMMIKEGTDNDWRLRWLVENGVSHWYAEVQDLFADAQRLGVAPNMDAHHFFYILTGAATLIFSMAPESRLVANIDPLEESVVSAHADALAELLFPGETA